MANKIEKGNLLDISNFRNNGHEQMQTLLKINSIELERIVSFGQSTPQGEWYEQSWDEWVMVAKGNAIVILEDGQEFPMKEGDYTFIKRNIRHRVSYTSDDCIWLALHLKEEISENVQEK